MNYKVAIPTAGLGSRLGEFTIDYNKSLLKLGDVAVISHIIDFYPSASFIILLGHRGDLVKDYIKLAHPEIYRKIQYVWVSDYDKEDASMLRSLSFAKEYLQEPFIIHACDTIAQYSVPNISENWTLSFNVRHKYLAYKSTHPTIDEWDVHTGVVGVNDTVEFWDIADRLLQHSDSTLNDISVLSLMKNVKRFFARTWFDTGNVKSYTEAVSHYKSSLPVLTKTTENIYVRKNRVIKLFSDSRKARKLSIRAWRYMGYDVPELLDTTKHGYSYKFIPGNTLIHSNSERLENFLNYCERNFWEHGYLGINFIDQCRRFYFDKTVQRVDKFLDKNKDPISVNGIKLLPINELLGILKHTTPIFMGVPARIHGDLVLENVIDTGNSYTFIDWRDEIFGSLKIGDLYYDLAKLSHNLVLQHDMLNKRAFEYDDSNSEDIIAYPSRSIRMSHLENTFWEWVRVNSFSESKIKAIRALIWINMAPLHESDIGKFLFAWGKLNLQLALAELKYE